MTTAATPAVRPAFVMKGNAFTFTVLELARTDTAAFSRELTERMAQSPALLRHAPVVLGLDKLDEADGALDLAALLAVCRLHTLQPVALRARRPDDLAQAAKLGLAVLAARSREAAGDGSEANTSRHAAPGSAAESGAGTAASSGGDATGSTANDTAAAPATPRTTRVVSQPVRSGQQIYAGGDLILLAPVSAGAEVMADGHIHVYAPLRGRALAGVQGDTGARIFCREFGAELVAIAGRFRTADELRSHVRWGKPAQVLLRDDELELEAL